MRSLRSPGIYPHPPTPLLSELQPHVGQGHPARKGFPHMCPVPAGRHPLWSLQASVLQGGRCSVPGTVLHSLKLSSCFPLSNTLGLCPKPPEYLICMEKRWLAVVSLMGLFKGVTHLQSLAHRKRQRRGSGAIGLDGGAMNPIVNICVVGWCCQGSGPGGSLPGSKSQSAHF